MPGCVGTWYSSMSTSEVPFVTWGEPESMLKLDRADLKHAVDHLFGPARVPLPRHMDAICPLHHQTRCNRTWWVP